MASRGELAQRFWGRDSNGWLYLELICGELQMESIVAVEKTPFAGSLEH